MQKHYYIKFQILDSFHVSDTWENLQDILMTLEAINYDNISPSSWKTSSCNLELSGARLCTTKFIVWMKPWIGFIEQWTNWYMHRHIHLAILTYTWVCSPSCWAFHNTQAFDTHVPMITMCKSTRLLKSVVKSYH